MGEGYDGEDKRKDIRHSQRTPLSCCAPPRVWASTTMRPGVIVGNNMTPDAWRLAGVYHLQEPLMRAIWDLLYALARIVGWINALSHGLTVQVRAWRTS